MLLLGAWALTGELVYLVPGGSVSISVLYLAPLPVNYAETLSKSLHWNAYFLLILAKRVSLIQVKEILIFHCHLKGAYESSYLITKEREI